MDSPEQGHPSDNALSRRRLLKIGAGTAAAAALGAWKSEDLYRTEVKGIQRLKQEFQSSPEVLAEPPEFVGFNTNLYPEQAVEHDLDLNAFKEDIDSLAQEGMNMMRFTLRPYAVVNSYHPENASVFTWNVATLAVYDEAIAYAKEKGIDIFLVLNTPEVARNASSSEYMQATSDYFSFITNRYKDQLTMVQLFNEPNVHDFHDYSSPFVDSAYMEAFREAAFVASSAVKAANPDIKTTINVGGWPLDEGRIAEWERFFDSTSDLIDVLSVDLYPDNNEDTIQHLKEWVQRLKKRFGKPVMIAEIGLATGTGRFSEGDQGKYLKKSIRELKGAGVVGILPYEIRDEARSGDPNEASFGIKHADGKHKMSYNTVMEVLKPEEENQQEQHK